MMEYLAQIILLLAVAISVVVLFQRLQIPTSLGYLLVGVILGPYTMGPTVSMPELATLSEFGIVFLLFTIGLSFSLPQLNALRHQILGLALGAETYKLKFGHRGGNQPVKVEATGEVQISSHNHGFAVRPESLPAGVTSSHTNLNDHTCEGLDAPAYRAFSVQYHPESSPGPHDSDALFDKFAQMMAAKEKATD